MKSVNVNPFERMHIPNTESWTWEECFRWAQQWATIYHNSTTREGRIAHYRLKEGKNVKYYDTYGWPEHF